MLLLVTLLHGCCSRFVNCVNGTKSCKASPLRNIFKNGQKRTFNLLVPGVSWKVTHTWPIKCQCCPHTETSQLICCANHLTDFYMRTTLALNGLNKLGVTHTAGHTYFQLQICLNMWNILVDTRNWRLKKTSQYLLKRNKNSDSINI